MLVSGRFILSPAIEEHTERRNVRVMLQNMNLLSEEFANVLSSVVAIWLTKLTAAEPAVNGYLGH